MPMHPKALCLQEALPWTLGYSFILHLIKLKREFEELKPIQSTKMDEEQIESLRVRIKGRARTGDIVVGVCYRPPNQQD